jgi:hypothetical protein
LEEAFQSGFVLDVILWFVMLEAVLLGVWRKVTGRGPALWSLLPNLVAGAALVLTARLALADAWWGWLAGALLLALTAHALDLRQRWGLS